MDKLDESAVTWIREHRHGEDEAWRGERYVLGYLNQAKSQVKQYAFPDFSYTDLGNCCHIMYASEKGIKVGYVDTVGEAQQTLIAKFREAFFDG